MEAIVVKSKSVARYYPRKTCKPISRRNMLKGSAALSALGMSGCGGSSSASVDFTPPPSSSTPPPAPTPPTGSGQHPIFGASWSKPYDSSI